MHPSSQPSSVISRGSQEFLLQAHRNNWQRYLAQLPTAAGGGAPRSRARAPWDLCILTASDARQAEMVTRQLEMRRAAGILPTATRFLVIPDPAGLRIGSGGATLRLLAALHNTAPITDPALDPLLEFDPAAQRILIIHSGGDSRRLPHASATGKLFTRIPRVLPDGRASTIFDEFLINLSGVAESVPPGVLLVSGDVLLVFDHLQLKLHRHGVTGVSVAVDAALGTRHGVYVNAPGSPDVQTFLHKASPDLLTAAGAVDDAGLVQIDTGLVWFEEATAHQFATLAQHAAIADLCGLTPNTDALRANTPINLYGDLLLPLARDTQADHYLHDSSDGPATPGLIAARRLLWEQLHRIQFSVERLQPAVFVHFGTSDEYWRMLADDPTLAATCGWSRQAGAWLTPLPPATQAGIVAMNAGLGPLPPDPAATTPALSASHPAPDHPLVVVDSHLAQGVRCSGPAVIAGVHTQHALSLPADCVLHQLPVQHGALAGFVTRLLGLRDDPKHPLGHPKGTYLHQPWTEWLAALG
jgi:fucokinase